MGAARSDPGRGEIPMALADHKPFMLPPAFREAVPNRSVKMKNKQDRLILETTRQDSSALPCPCKIDR